MAILDYYFDIVPKAWVTSTGARVTQDSQRPDISFREKKTIRLHLYENGSAFEGFQGLSPSFEWAIDNNWRHKIDGELTGSLSGTITELSLNLTESGTVPSSGRIVLKNTAGESEVVEYESYDQDSGGTYTFTIEGSGGVALTYSYASGDSADVKDALIIRTENSGITVVDLNNAIFDVYMDAETEKFESEVEDTSQIAGCLFEMKAYISGEMEFRTYGPFVCVNILDDTTGIAPSAQGNDYYTKTQTDSLLDALEQQGIFVYDASRSYADDDFCHYQGVLYVSNTNGNQGNTPGDSATIEWDEYAAGGGGGSGDVVGPSSSTDNALVRFDGTTGKLISECQSNAPILADNGILTLLNYLILDEIKSSGSINAVTVADVLMSEGTVTVDDDAYSESGWNGDLTVPTKNAIRDKLVSLVLEFVSTTLSDYTLQTAIDGTEKIFINDSAGAAAVIRANLFALASHTHPGTEHEISTPASELTSEDNGKPVTAQVSETDQTIPTDVKLMLHFSGSEGDSTIVDRSQFAHTVDYTSGTPLISSIGKFGTGLELVGDDGFGYDDTNFAIGASDFVFSIFFQATASQEDAYQPLISFGDNNEILDVAWDGVNDELVVKFGQDYGSGSFTDELALPSTLNSDQMNHILLCRSATSGLLFIGMNGEVLLEYDMTNKTIIAPSSDTLKFGYTNSVPDSDTLYADGYIDEVFVSIGSDRASDFALVSGTATYTVLTAPQYTTQKYDISDAGAGAYYGTFTDSDLDSAGVLTVAHNLNQTVLAGVTIADNNNYQKEPDEIIFVDSDTMQIDLSSFGTLTGTWRVTAVRGGIADAAAGAGEVNTASNVGDSGEGIFKTKNGVDLEFYNIAPGSAKLLITLNSGRDNVEIDIDTAELSKLLPTLITTDTTITEAHVGQTLYCDDSADVTLTIPLDSAEDLDDNVTILLCAEGSMTLTVTADSDSAESVSLNGVAAGSVEITPQFGYATLTKRGANSWYIFGAIGTVA